MKKLLSSFDCKQIPVVTALYYVHEKDLFVSAVIKSIFYTNQQHGMLHVLDDLQEKH